MPHETRRPPFRKVEEYIEKATREEDFLSRWRVAASLYPDEYRAPTTYGATSEVLSREARVQLLRERESRGEVLFHPGDLLSMPALEDCGVGVLIGHGRNGSDIQLGVECG